MTHYAKGSSEYKVILLVNWEQKFQKQGHNIRYQFSSHNIRNDNPTV